MAKLRMLQPALRAADLRAVKPAPKVGNPFYSSAEWIELRDRVRREAGGQCQWPGCAHRGQFVDHIVELKDGGAPLARSNVWYLCSSHHVRKTNAERAKRGDSRYN